MKLFLIHFDGEPYYVNSQGFTEAIDAWKDHVKELWGDDYEGDEIPESVALIHDGPVIDGRFPKKQQSTPLTIGELELGDYWISFPQDGDDSGHGGYRRGSYVFRKMNADKSIRLKDGVESTHTGPSYDMKVLKVFV